MDTATVDVGSAADAKVVQHVTKKSSDELLRKFAELGSAEEEEGAAKKRSELRLCKRLKKRREDHSDSPSGGAAMVERRSLLPPAVTRRSMLLRHLRARDIRNRSLLGTIQKTWRRTVEGASRVFIEKHYHRHKRLINDV